MSTERKHIKDVPTIREQMDAVVAPIFDRDSGYRLKMYRLKERLEQRDLAFLLGVSQQYVSKLEIGYPVKPMFTLEQLIKVVGFPATTWVLTGKNPSRFDPMGRVEQFLEWRRQKILRG